MAADITTLGLAVDSSQVVRARNDLGQLTSAGDKAADSASKLEGSWGSLKGAIAGLALGATAFEMIKLADSMTLMGARLKLATETTENFVTAQAQVYAIAQKSNVGLEETAQLYTRLYDPVKRLGGGTKETGMIVESFAASLRVGGASAQEAASATLQFAQAMGSGKLQGDEFRAIAEASPRFMRAMAEGMNVPIEQLKKMSSEGKLTADIVGNALMKSLGQLKREMESMPDTVGGAMTRMKNDFKVSIDEINKASGTTLGIAAGIDEARKLIPAIKNEMISAFASVGEWIERNKEGMLDIWDVVKGTVADVWELVKVGGNVLGWLAEVLIQSGAIKYTFTALRFLVAGFSDGVELIAAGFTKAGAILLGVVGYFSDSAKAASEAAHAAADATFKKFADGKTSVIQLSEALEKHNIQQQQAKEAMAQSTLSAKDLSDENRRLTGRVVETADAHVTLKNKHIELTKEQEHAKQRYTDLTQTIREHVTQLNAEEAGGVKLNEAQKGLIKFKEELVDKYKLFTPAQRTSITNLYAEWDAKIKVKEATDLLRQAEEDAWKQRQKDNEALWKKVEALTEAVKKQGEENEKLSHTKEQLAALEIARLNDSIRIAEQMVATDEFTKVCTEETEAHKATLEALKNLKSAKEQGVVLEAAKEARDAWAKTSEEIGKSFTDSLFRAFEQGKSFGEALMDGLKNLFKTTVLKLVIQPVQNALNNVIGGAINSLTGGALGASGASGASGGSILGSLGNLYSLYSAGSGSGGIAGGLSNVYSGLFGSGAATAGSSVVATTAAEAAFLEANGAIASYGAGSAGAASSGAAAGASGSALAYAGYAALIYAAVVKAQSDYAAGYTGAYAKSAEDGLGFGKIGAHTPDGLAFRTLKGFGVNDEWASVLSGAPATGKILDKLGLVASHHQGSVVAIDTAGKATTKYGDGSTITDHYNDNADQSLRFLGGTSTTLLNSLSKLFGGSGGFSELLKFAVDGKDASIGQASISRNGTQVGYVGEGADFAHYSKNGKEAFDAFAIDVAKATRQALDAVALPAWARKMFEGLTDNATLDDISKVIAHAVAFQAQLRNVQESVAPLGGVFAQVAGLSGDALKQLTDFAGGIQAFGEKVGSYVKNYYTEGEQAAISSAAIKRQLEAVGFAAGDLAGLKSREDFRALVDANGVGTEDARKRLAALLDVQTSFAQIADYIAKSGSGTFGGLSLLAPAVAAFGDLNAANTVASASSVTPDATAVTASVDATTDAVVAGNMLLTEIRDGLAAGTAATAALAESINASNADVAAAVDRTGRALEDIAASIP